MTNVIKNNEKVFSKIDTKKNYNCVDLFKLLAALLVVCIHANEVKELIPNVICYSFSNFAVPFFFIVSGFFFKKGLDKKNSAKQKFDYFSKYEKRLLLIYLFWSLINLPFTLMGYISLNEGASFIKLTALILRRYFLCGNGVVWYILSMAEAAAVIYLLDKFKRKHLLYIFIILGLFLCLCYDSFDKLLINTPLGLVNKAFYTIFSWSNNFIMKAIPYMGIGYLMVNIKNKFSLPTLWISFTFFSILSVLSFFAYDLTKLHIFNVISFGPIISIIQAVLFSLLAININLKISTKLAVILRELSSSIYFLHTYFIYYVSNIIFGIDFYYMLKVLIAVIGSVVVYVVAKRTKFKPLMFALNIKY